MNFFCTLLSQLAIFKSVHLVFHSSAPIHYSTQLQSSACMGVSSVTIITSTKWKCSRPLSPIAPVIFLELHDQEAVSRNELNPSFFSSFLPFCAPWINLLCQLPQQPNRSSGTTASQSDLRCCDAYLLRCSFDKINLAHCTAIVDNLETPESAGVAHGWRLAKSQGVLQWLVFGRNLACSPCGLTVDVANDALSSSWSSFRIVILSYPMAIFNGESNQTQLVSENYVGDRRGFERAMLESIAHTRNITLEHNFAPEMVSYGMEPDDEQGSARSLITRISRKENHMAYGDVTLFWSRSLYIDYSYPHDIDMLTVIYKVTEQKGSSVSKLIRVASPPYLLLGSLVTAYLSIREYTKSGNSHGTKASIQFVLLFIRCSINIILKPFYFHTDSKATSTTADRIVHSVWNLGALIIATTFTIYILRSLATRVLNVFSDFDHIASAVKTSMNPHVMIGEDYRDILASLNTSSELALLMLKAGSPYCYEIDDCVKQMSQSSSSVSLSVGEVESLYGVIWREHLAGQAHICSTDAFYQAMRGFVFPKGCFLSKLFSREAQRLSEHGLIFIYKMRAGLERPTMSFTSMQQHTLKLDRFATMSNNYLIIWLLAVNCLVLELLISNCYSWKWTKIWEIFVKLYRYILHRKYSFERSSS